MDTNTISPFNCMCYYVPFACVIMFHSFFNFFVSQTNSVLEYARHKVM